MKIKILISSICLLTILSCSKQDDIIEMPITSTESTILQKNVIELDNDNSVINNINGVLQMRKSSFTDTLKLGDIIVSDLSNKLNEGFLGKVTKIEEIDNVIQITTKPAALTEVFVKCSVRVSQPLIPDDTLRNINFEQKFSYTIYDGDNDENTKDDQVKILGNVSTTLNFVFELDIDGSKLTHLKTGFDTEDNLELEIGTEVNYAKFEKDKALKSFNFASFVVPVGPLPIVVFPALVLRVGGKAELKGGVGIKTTLTDSKSSFVEYKNDNWTLSNNTNPLISLNEANIKGELDAELYLKIGIEFYLFNLKDIKSSINIKPYVKATASCSTNDFDCNYSLSAGAKLEARIKVEMFDNKLVDYTNTLASIEKIFSSGSFKAASGFMTDSRDGQKYKWVKIGDQIWLAENLRYKTSNSFSSVNGELYNPLVAQNSCPLGYHYPSFDEVNTLFQYSGGKNNAWSKLLSKELGGTDEFGFNLQSRISASFKGNGLDFSNINNWDFGEFIPGILTFQPISGTTPNFNIPYCIFYFDTQTKDADYFCDNTGFKFSDTSESLAKSTCRCIKN